jgi:hypothetical protein
MRGSFLQRCLEPIVFFGLFLALAFPLFYFVYKFGDPEPLAHDFFQYYRLYKNWDLEHVQAPFNMRVLGSYIVHLFNLSGFSYDTEIVFDKYKDWGFEKSVYFNAVFFNFLCVSATCVQVYYLLKRQLGEQLISFMGAIFYLLGFGTIFYELMPLTDAFSVLLFSIVLHLYLNENYRCLLILPLFILQREYILAAMTLYALMDFVKTGKRFFLYACLVSFVSFAVYYWLRKTWFYTPALDAQSSPAHMMENLMTLHFPLAEFIRQTAMTLNLFFIYLAVVIYKKINSLNISGFNLFKSLMLFLQAIFLSIAGGHGNNAGRYYYLVVPIVIFFLVKELSPLFKGEKTHIPKPVTRNP